MKWMLVMIVLGMQPVKTDLMYDDVEACSTAANIIQQFQAEAYNAAMARKKRQNPSADELKAFAADRMRVLGIENLLTCIPHR